MSIKLLHKSLIFVTSLTLMVSGVLGYILVHKSKALLHEEVATRAQTLLGHLQDRLSPALESQQPPPVLESLLQGSLKREGVAYVRVLSADGSVLAHSSSPQLAPSSLEPPGAEGSSTVFSSRQEFLNVSQAVFSSQGGHPRPGEEPLAVVQLGLSLENLHQKTRRLDRFALGAAGLVTGAAVLLSFFFFAWLTRRIRRLLSAGEKISRGESVQAVPVDSPDELGDLARLLNTLRNELHKSVVSRDYLSGIMNSMTDTLVVLDTDRTIRMVNKSLLDLLGYKESELIGQPIERLAANQEKPTLAPNFKKFIEKGLLKDYKLNYFSKDNQAIPMHFNGAAMGDAAGKVVGYVGVARDMRETLKVLEQGALLMVERERVDKLEKEIRRRQKIEKSLRLTQFSVDNAADAVFMVGTNARFLYVSKQACEQLGYSQEELLSMSMQDIDFQFSSDLWPLHWEELKKRGHSVYESHHRAKDGRIIPVEVTITYLSLDGHDYNWAYVRDITQRKKAEEQLRKSEDRFDAFFKTAPIGMGVFDEQFRFTNVNRLLADFNGHSVEEHLGRTVVEVLEDEDLGEKIEGYLVEAFKGGTTLNVELTSAVPGSPERKRAWLSSYFPIYDFRYNKRNVGACFMEITHLKDLEKERRKLEAQILETISREQKKIGQDLHDGLGQYLTGIAYSARALDKKLKKENSSGAEDLAKIVELANKSTIKAKMLARMLYPVELESGGIKLALQSLSMLARDIYGINCEAKFSKGSFVFDLPRSSHVYRIAQEAISNAVRHGKADGVIIELIGEGDNVILRVTDNGLGLSAKSGERGSGMGMSIMKYRAHEIQAVIDFKPGPEKGVVVNCVFPRVPRS